MISGLLIGGNDLANGSSLQVAKENYKSLIELILSLNPDCSLVLFALVPRPYDLSSFIINSFNVCLRELSAEFHCVFNNRISCIFLDSFKSIKLTMLNGHDRWPYLHPLPEVKVRMAQIVDSVLTEVLHSLGLLSPKFVQNPESVLSMHFRVDPSILEGLPSVEHAFQLRKAVFHHDWEQACAIVSTSSPQAARIEGSKIVTSPAWSLQSVTELESILLDRFVKEPRFRRALMATKLRDLLCTDNDHWWGTGPNLQGQNKYGAALMRLRSRSSHS